MTAERQETEPAPARGRLGARIAAVVILIGAAIVLVDAIRIAASSGFAPQQSGFFPLIVGIGLVVFGLAFLVRTTAKPDADLAAKAAEAHGATHWKTLWSVFGALIAYAFLLEPLGYIIATALFIVAVTFLADSRKWIRNIVVAVLFSVAVFFGFTELLGVQLPAGLLETVL